MTRSPPDTIKDFSFDDFTINVKTSLLLKAGEKVPLGPRPFEVLLHLIKKHDRVVTKQDLFEQVWGTDFVTDSALTQVIKEIRLALGDDAQSPRYIRTVHRKGYQFIAPLSDGNHVAKRWWRLLRFALLLSAPVILILAVPLWFNSTEPQYSPNSIAVLPFVNMSSDPEQEYFSDGISEELLYLLANIPELRVIARTSSFAFKGKDTKIEDVARELNVSYILEGSVRKSGNQVRITAQLIRSADSFQLWSQSYDRTLNDIFVIQDEIALALIEQLKIILLGDTPMINETTPEAYELYLKAKDYFNRGLGDPSIVTAAELYERVVEIDPTFVLGYVGLAKAQSRIVFQGIDQTQRQRNQARKSIEMAYQLGEEIPAVHTAHGWYYYWVVGDYDIALKWFKTALAKLPYDSESLLGLGLAERRLGHLNEALRHLLLSFDLDPLSNEKAIEVGVSYAFQHDYVEAISFFRKAVDLAPRQFRSYSHLAEALIGKNGAIDIALNTLRKGGDVLGPDEFIRRMLSGQSPWATQMLLLSAFPDEFEKLDLESLTREQSIHYLILRAEQYRRLGQKDFASVTAETLLGRLGNSVGPYGRHVGLAYAHLGQRREAAQYLTVSQEEIRTNARQYQHYVLMEAYGHLLLGSQDTAIERIDHALSVPGPISFATILASPIWLDLQFHIKFQLLRSKYEYE